MNFCLPGPEAVALLGLGQLGQDEQGADQVGEGGGDGRALHAEVKARHKDQVQHDVQQAAEHEIVQGPLGVAHGPQNAGAHVKQEHGDGADEVPAEVERGVGHDLLGVFQPDQGLRGEQDAHDGDDDAAEETEGDRRMDRPR